MRPHNLPFVMLGAGLLWFGWYGFNAGSALNSNGIAASTFVTTTVATAAAMLAWLLTEKIRDGHATSLGAASGIVAGLVVITPSCSSVNVVGALAIGCDRRLPLRPGGGAEIQAGLRPTRSDVVGVHMIGGLTGTLLIGLFAAPEAPAAVKGLFYAVVRSAVAPGSWCFAVLGYSFIVTTIFGLDPEVHHRSSPRR